MKETTGDRLEKLKKELHLTNISLAAMMKTDNSTVGKIIKGEGSLSLTTKMLLELHSKNVNIIWLLTGAGSMFYKQEQPLNQEEKKKELEEIKSSLTILSLAVGRLAGLNEEEIRNVLSVDLSGNKKLPYQDLRQKGKKQKSDS